jgi:cell shape-determining protein MreC
MLGRILKKKKNTPVKTDIFLDHPTYDKFRAYATKNGLDESSALAQVLERGMANYWLQEFKHLKQNYLPMKNLFKDYEKDNEALRAIEKQNERLQKILDEQCQQRKTSNEPINAKVKA